MLNPPLMTRELRSNGADRCRTDSSVGPFRSVGPKCLRTENLIQFVGESGKSVLDQLYNCFLFRPVGHHYRQEPLDSGDVLSLVRGRRFSRVPTQCDLTPVGQVGTFLCCRTKLILLC